jgi:two-component system, OmpR family, KDP operon response regulator KdpE
MMPETVLVVEDESRMRRFLWEALSDRGYRVAEATTLAQAERLAEQHRPALILLDLVLPDGDGMQLLRHVRERRRTPIIVLSGRDGEQEKVNALDAGANDYLTKPFGMQELLARIRVALRLAGQSPEPDDGRLTVGSISIDIPRHEVRIDGELMHLTPIEFRLLLTLARNAGRVLTHRQLLSEVWGPERTNQTHHLRVHVAALRRKIERDPARPRWLQTEAGIGYRLRDE